MKGRTKPLVCKAISNKVCVSARDKKHELVLAAHAVYHGSEGIFMDAVVIELSCPRPSGPGTMIVWITKGMTNAEQEAQAGRDHRQAA